MESRSHAELRINGPRLLERLAALAEIGETPACGVSRVAYSEADLQGREYVVEQMRAAGLDPLTDAAGNLIGRSAGSSPDLPPLTLGSHIDTVPEGGRYDGAVGSLAAVEVAHTLMENGVTTRHPLEVIIFQNEEGGLVGSRALSGELRESELEQLTHSGLTIRQGIARSGGDPTSLDRVQRPPDSLAAFLELHIEQGGVLDAAGIDIGIVEGIVGIHWWEVTIEGVANHAGTTPMHQRRDALLAAGRFIEAVHRVVTGAPGPQVGTVGRIQAFPGAPNVIAGKVVASLELRALEEAMIRQLFERIEAEVRQIARDTGTTFGFQLTNVNVPAPADARLREMIAESVRALGLSAQAMPSGAAHDAQSMARLGPAGMIFIPSVGGVSHSPRELSRAEDVVNGANVLLQTVIRLDSSVGRQPDIT